MNGIDNSMEILFQLPQYLFDLVDPYIKFKELQSNLKEKSQIINKDNVFSIKKYAKLKTDTKNARDISENVEINRLSPLKRKIVKISNKDDLAFKYIYKKNSNQENSNNFAIKLRKISKNKGNEDIYFTRAWREAKKLEKEVQLVIKDANHNLSTNPILKEANINLVNPPKTLHFKSKLSKKFSNGNILKINDLDTEDQKSINCSQKSLKVDISKKSINKWNNTRINTSVKISKKNLNNFYKDQSFSKLSQKNTSDPGSNNNFLPQKKKEAFNKRKESTEVVDSLNKLLRINQNKLSLKQKENIFKLYKRPQAISNKGNLKNNTHKGSYLNNNSFTTNSNKIDKYKSINQDDDFYNYSSDNFLKSNINQKVLHANNDNISTLNCGHCVKPNEEAQAISIKEHKLLNKTNNIKLQNFNAIIGTIDNVENQISKSSHNNTKAKYRKKKKVPTATLR